MHQQTPEGTNRNLHSFKHLLILFDGRTRAFDADVPNNRQLATLAVIVDNRLFWSCFVGADVFKRVLEQPCVVSGVENNLILNKHNTFPFLSLS